MKKLLTLLLAIAVAACLVNFNSNIANADGENDDVVTVDTAITFGREGVSSPKWYKGAIQASNEFKAADYTKYGMEYIPGTGGEPGTTTFSKSLTSSITNNATVEIFADTKVVIKNNISISHTNGESGLNVNQNITIDGNGNTLKVSTTGEDYSFDFRDSYGLKLKNITLECENNSSNYQTICGDKLYLIGDCTVEGTNKNNSGAAFKMTDSDPIFSPTAIVQTMEGNADALKTPLDDIVRDANNVYHVGSAAGSIARYIKLVNKEPQPEPEPTPSPSPSKKDESCEKVIGPTWHWNNDKGICEEYATVGTSTR